MDVDDLQERGLLAIWKLTDYLPLNSVSELKFSFIKA